MSWRSDLPFGSPAWIDYVYSSPPARDPRGRSRPTQRSSPHSDALGRSVGIEGGNELTACLLLEIWVACGLVRRFKEQPFALDAALYGKGAIPDFIFEWRDGTHVVAEVKSSAFYTAEKIQAAERLSNFLTEHGLRYVVWQTNAHLTRRAWHNVRQVRGAKHLVPEPHALERLLSDLNGTSMTYQQLIANGHDTELIRHAVWTGKAHFNLLEKMNVSTEISATANAGHYAALIGARPDPNEWWNSLPDCGEQ